MIKDRLVSGLRMAEGPAKRHMGYLTSMVWAIKWDLLPFEIIQNNKKERNMILGTHSRQFMYQLLQLKSHILIRTLGDVFFSLFAEVS